MSIDIYYAKLKERVAELEQEVTEQAVLNGKGSEREARLLAKVAELEKENAALKKSIDRHGKANDEFMFDNARLRKDKELLLDKLHDIAICADKKWIEKEVFEVEQLINENK